MTASNAPVDVAGNAAAVRALVENYLAADQGSGSSSKDLPMEVLLTEMAIQQACSFHAGDQDFTPEQIFAADGFSLVPLVVLQAVRIGLELGKDALLQMSLVGAVSAPDPSGAAGLSVKVRPMRGDELAVYRGLLYLQAADQVFNWLNEKTIDLAVIYQSFKEGYELERRALEAYTAHQAATLNEVPARRITETM